MNITLDKNDAQLTGLLTVQLTEADYAAAVDKQLKESAKRAQVKGFRPGKVPAGLVKKMYGKGILADELNRILGKAVDGYVQEHNLNLLGEPLPMANEIDLDNATDFDFKFELGFLQDFALPNSLGVERHQVRLDEATIQQTHEQIARQHGETTNPETSEAGDYLFGKLKKAGAEGEGRTVLLPTNKVTGDVAPFVGVKPGDAVKFDLGVFGGDAAAVANLLGMKKDDVAVGGEYEMAVEKINRTTAPEMNQELFDKVFGPEEVASEEEFSAKVREVIQANYDREAEGVLNNKMVDGFVNAVDVQLPREYFKKWLLRINDGKLTREQIEEHYDDYAKEMKWSLIRNKVAREADLKVSEAEVIDRALDRILGQFQMANAPGDMRESLRGYAIQMLEKDNGKQYRDEYEAILAEKVLGVLRGKVVVTDQAVTAEEFRALHG